MSIRQLCFTEWHQCVKFEVPSGKNVQWYNMRPYITYFHTGLICSRFFQKYAYKGWLSLETMKFWLLVLTKTLFLMTLIIKLTLGNIFIKMKNPPGGATVTK